MNFIFNSCWKTEKTQSLGRNFFLMLLRKGRWTVANLATIIPASVFLLPSLPDWRLPGGHTPPDRSGTWEAGNRKARRWEEERMTDGENGKVAFWSSSFLTQQEVLKRPRPLFPPFWFSDQDNTTVSWKVVLIPHPFFRLYLIDNTEKFQIRSHLGSGNVFTSKV